MAPSLPAGLDLDWLVDVVVNHDVAGRARRFGPPESFARVPPHKRLGVKGPEYGLPIGNLTSQFFANVYLDPLDQFIKRTLGARHYVRYVDDFVLVHDDPTRLEEWERRIVEFLREKLRLEVRRSRPLRPVSGGVDFVGYVVRPDYRLARRRVVDALDARVTALETKLAATTVNAGEVFRHDDLGVLVGPLRVTELASDVLERLRAVWASGFGHLAHADARRLTHRLLEGHPRSRRLLRWRPVRRQLARRITLARPYERLHQQIDALRRAWSGPEALIVRIGRWGVVPFDPLPRLRRRRVAGRVMPAFPWSTLGPRVSRWLSQGRSIVLAVERAEAAGNVKRRDLAWLLDPTGGSGAPLIVPEVAASGPSRALLSRSSRGAAASPTDELHRPCPEQEQPEAVRPVQLSLPFVLNGDR